MPIHFMSRSLLHVQTALLAWLCFCFCDHAGAKPVSAQRPDEFFAGAAQVDITPNYPILMNGYLHRPQESAGVLLPIHATALALGSDAQTPALLIAVDNCGLPSQVRTELLQRLERFGITEERLAICASHTHAAPKLAGSIDNIFGADIPAPEQARIERYTKEFIDRLEQVARKALEQRKPARLRWGQTRAGFARNRRVPFGCLPSRFWPLTLGF